MKPPAFQFYADDFIGGTCDLSAADVGAYIRLLCYQWSRGAIPSEPEKLERVAGGKVSADVLAKFPGGKNARMEQEREKQAAFREDQRRKGIASGQARREQRFNRGSTTVQPSPQPEGQPKSNSPSPSPSPSPSSVSKEEGEGKLLPRESCEVPDKPGAIAQTMTAGIPADFAGYVYDDWESRGGKDGGGNMVPWLRYVTKRWAREGTEWRNGTHSALKRQKTPPPHAVMGTPHDLKAKTL